MRFAMDPDTHRPGAARLGGRSLRRCTQDRRRDGSLDHPHRDQHLARYQQHVRLFAILRTSRPPTTERQYKVTMPKAQRTRPQWAGRSAASSRPCMYFVYSSTFGTHGRKYESVRSASIAWYRRQDIGGAAKAEQMRGGGEGSEDEDSIYYVMTIACNARVDVTSAPPLCACTVLCKFSELSLSVAFLAGDGLDTPASPGFVPRPPPHDGEVAERKARQGY